MLAEHLNDCSWRHRVMALKCLPKLYGDINTDIQNKIVSLSVVYIAVDFVWYVKLITDKRINLTDFFSPLES